MSITRLHVGPRMSQAVVHGATDLSRRPGRRSGEGQERRPSRRREILAAIDRLLAEAGSDKTKILSATIYLADIATFAEMNAVWDAWIPAGHTPARATVEAKLAAPPTRSRSPASPPRPEEAAAGPTRQVESSVADAIREPCVMGPFERVHDPRRSRRSPRAAL